MPGAQAGSPAGHQHAGAARAVLEGLPADLALLSPEKSPEREDAVTAVTQCPAHRKQTLPSSMPSSTAAASPSCPLF